VAFLVSMYAPEVLTSVTKSGNAATNVSAVVEKSSGDCVLCGAAGKSVIVGKVIAYTSPSTSIVASEKLGLEMLIPKLR